GNRQDECVDVADELLVQMVADAGSVAEQMPDRHVRRESFDPAADDLGRGRVEAKRSILDQLRDGERGEAFRAASDAEACIQIVGSGVRAVAVAERLAVGGSAYPEFDYARELRIRSRALDTLDEIMRHARRGCERRAPLRLAVDQGEQRGGIGGL